MTTITLRCRNGCDCVSIIMMMYLSIDLYSRSSDNSRLTHEVSLKLTHIVSFKTKTKQTWSSASKSKSKTFRLDKSLASSASLSCCCCCIRGHVLDDLNTRIIARLGQRTGQRTERTKTKVKGQRSKMELKLTVCRSERNSKANCKMNETNHVGKCMNGQSRSWCRIKDPRSIGRIQESRSKI